MIRTISLFRGDIFVGTVTGEIIEYKEGAIPGWGTAQAKVSFNGEDRTIACWVHPRGCGGEAPAGWAWWEKVDK